ncbi:MAG: helix-turn-helix domain-containing protein [Candidatus Atribacteria bacterium]|nr:helix-turn-helix domain-containing protein [Candidatus Atribacteria bacterium]
MDLRRELIYRYLNKEKVMDLCREYGISRKTAYKYIHRFQAFGLDGFKDYNNSWLVSFSCYDIGTIDKKTLTFESTEIQDD